MYSHPVFYTKGMQEKLPVAGSLHIRSMNENASGLVSGSSLDQINDGVDRILLRRILHGLNVCFTILIQVHDRIKKNIMIKLFLFKNDTVALTFEERAFKIWSPRLAFAESGIRRFGLCSARSSQIALAPALEITRSVRAKRSFNSSLIYSNCA